MSTCCIFGCHTFYPLIMINFRAVMSWKVTPSDFKRKELDLIVRISYSYFIDLADKCASVHATHFGCIKRITNFSRNFRDNYFHDSPKLVLKNVQLPSKYFFVCCFFFLFFKFLNNSQATKFCKIFRSRESLFSALLSENVTLESFMLEYHIIQEIYKLFGW